MPVYERGQSAESASQANMSKFYETNAPGIRINDIICEARNPLRRHLFGYAVMRKDEERAHAYLVAAFQQEKDGEDQLTAASIAIHLGAWYFAHDMVTEAGKHAKKAHERAQHFGDSIIAAETSLLLGHIAYARSRSREGDRYFVAGLEMLGRLRRRDELVEVLSWCSIGKRSPRSLTVTP